MNMISIDDKIVTKIRKAKRGSLFFVEDFLNIGSAKAVAKVLERLVEKGGISCLLYTSPSPRDGLLSRMPSSA